MHFNRVYLITKLRRGANDFLMQPTLAFVFPHNAIRARKNDSEKCFDASAALRILLEEGNPAYQESTRAVTRGVYPSDCWSGARIHKSQEVREGWACVIAFWEAFWILGEKS